MAREAPTVKERVLIHLSNLGIESSDAEFPREATQQGIAEATGASRPHVSMALRELEDRGLVEKLLAHVSGQKRRVNVYIPTSEGRAQGRKLRAAFPVQAKPSGEPNATSPHLETVTVPAYHQFSYSTTDSWPSDVEVNVGTGVNDPSSVTDGMRVAAAILGLVTLSLMFLTATTTLSHISDIGDMICGLALLYIFTILLDTVFIFGWGGKFMNSPETTDRALVLALAEGYVLMFVVPIFLLFRILIDGIYILITVGFVVAFYAAYSSDNANGSEAPLLPAVAAAYLSAAWVYNLSVEMNLPGLIASSLAALDIIYLGRNEKGGTPVMHIAAGLVVGLIIGVLFNLTVSLLASVAVASIAVPAALYVAELSTGKIKGGDVAVVGGPVLGFMAVVALSLGSLFGFFFEAFLAVLVFYGQRNRFSTLIRGRSVFLASVIVEVITLSVWVLLLMADVL